MDVCGVRFVIHWGLPCTVFDCVQQVGRGGECLFNAACSVVPLVLLLSGVDVPLVKFVALLSNTGRDEKPAQCFALYALTGSLRWAELSSAQPAAERPILEMQAFAAQPNGCRSAHLQQRFDVSVDADAVASAAPAAAASQDAVTDSACCEVCSGSVAATNGSVSPHCGAVLRDALMTVSGTNADSRAT